MPSSKEEPQERFVSKEDELRLVNVREPGKPVPIEKEEDEKDASSA